MGLCIFSAYPSFYYLYEYDVYRTTICHSLYILSFLRKKVGTYRRKLCLHCYTALAFFSLWGFKTLRRQGIYPIKYLYHGICLNIKKKFLFTFAFPFDNFIEKWDYRHKRLRKKNNCLKSLEIHSVNQSIKNFQKL